ncbi:MAG: hypothetical protein CSA97_01400, partial [Bacteroidetes bacterium]
DGEWLLFAAVTEIFRGEKQGSFWAVKTDGSRQELFHRDRISLQNMPRFIPSDGHRIAFKGYFQEGYEGEDGEMLEGVSYEVLFAYDLDKGERFEHLADGISYWAVGSVR